MVFAIHWHESAMDLHVFPIPIPSPVSLPIWSLWVFPVHQPWTLVCKRTFKIFFSSNFQRFQYYSLWSLCCTSHSPCIYFITGSLYLVIPFTYFTHPTSHLWLPLICSIYELSFRNFFKRFHMLSEITWYLSLTYFI